MNKFKITYWKDGDFYLGYINDYSEYLTQGETLDELSNNLKDIYKDLIEENIPGIKKTLELELT